MTVHYTKQQRSHAKAENLELVTIDLAGFRFQGPVAAELASMLDDFAMRWMTERTLQDDLPINYAEPPLAEILQAVPLLQWRRCFRCKCEALYRDNMLPACQCHKCGSADTRPMRDANVRLHRTGGDA